MIQRCCPLMQVMLEFENSLLSVVPELRAMPYW